MKKRPPAPAYSGLTWWRSLSPEEKVSVVRPLIEGYGMSNGDIVAHLMLKTIGPVASVRHKIKKKKEAKALGKTAKKQKVQPKPKEKQKPPLASPSRVPQAGPAPVVAPSPPIGFPRPKPPARAVPLPLTRPQAPVQEVEYKSKDGKVLVEPGAPQRSNVPLRGRGQKAPQTYPRYISAAERAKRGHLDEDE